MITSLVITGNTYCCRSELSAMGGRWVPHIDAWLVPHDQRQTAQHLCRVMGFNLTTLSVPWDLPYHRSRPSSPATR